ncbi:MAG: hypothetical protein ACRDVC_08040 [Acidimicrobiales bacterium]
MRGLDARSLATYVLRHPAEGPVMARAAWRLRRREWWRRAPFLPLPGRGYWQFRLATATGSPDGMTNVKEVVEYARWSDQQRMRR